MLYDQLGRMTSRTEAEGSSSWTYDTRWIGALSSESSGISSKSYLYDTFGRVKSSDTTINGQVFNVTTSYDNIGRVSRITYPTGVVIQRNYNAYSHMVSISNASTGQVLWSANTMDEFGHLTSESFGNGVTTTRTYDPNRGILTGLQSTSNGATIQNWAYDYDAVGNMNFRTDTVLGYTENFGYDALNRLETVSNTAGVLEKSYSYDEIGNITFKSDVGSYQYTDLNHTHAVTSAGANTYTYDANGNMLNGAGRTHSWTSFNKPAGIWTAQGYTGFAYDANHNRISKTTPTSETVYIGKIFEQTTMGGIIKNTSNVYAGSKLIASIQDTAGVPSIHYMHGDHLGSISMITDEFGAVAERLRFDAFGAPVNLDGSAKANIGANNTTRGYTGHEMDASTGLINMNARLYDPVLGRFISADTVITDPMRMQDFNRYSYVLNNPLMYTDPSGHSWWTSFRNSFLVPVARTVMTVVIVAGLMYVGVDAYTATAIANFATSAAFGGNFEENAVSGIMAGINMAVGDLTGMEGAGRIFDIGVAQAGEAGQNGGGSSGFSVAAPSGYIAGVAAITAEGKSQSVAQTNAFQRLFKDESKIGTSSDYAAGIGKYAKIRPDNNIKVLEDFGDMSMLAATVLSVTAPPFAAPFVAMGIAFHGSAYYLGGNGNSSYIDAIMLGVDKGLSSIGVVGRVKGFIGAAEGYLINRAGSE